MASPRPENKSFLSFDGVIQADQCWQTEKQLKVKINKSTYDKIVSECDLLSSQAILSNQPYYPAWQQGDEYFCKVLLSKAKKGLFEELVQLKGNNIFNVCAIPFEIKNVQTGHIDGISLYFHHTVKPIIRAKRTRPASADISNAQEPL